MPSKPPVWTWEVPAYLFAGGAAGAAAVIAGAAHFAHADPGLVLTARIVAAIGAVVSPVLLVSDLGRPQRFLYMLRVFKPQSTMSVGAWTLVVFTFATFAALALATPIGRALTGSTALTAAADMLGIFTGLVLATYTGVLLGATAIPVWAANASYLPLHFAASSLGAAAGMIELAGRADTALHRIGLAAALMETVALAVMEIDWRGGHQTLPSGVGRQMIRVGHVFTGLLALVLRLATARWPAARALAGVAAIGGSLVNRMGWMASGRASALQDRSQ